MPNVEANTRRYETTFILVPETEEEERESAIERIRELIQAIGGTVLKTDERGTRRLAYEIDGYREGFYATTYFEAPADRISELNRDISLQPLVIRHILFRPETHVEAEKTRS